MATLNRSAPAPIDPEGRDVAPDMVRSPTSIVLIAFVALAALVAVAQPTSSAYSGATQTPINYFSTAASFEPTCTKNAAWVEGMEPGAGLTPYMFTSQLLASLDSNVKRTGTYSVRLQKGANSTSYARKAGFPVGGAGGNALVLSFAFRVAALPSGDVTFMWLDRIAQDLFVKYNASTQKLTLQWGANAAVDANVALTANEWHQIEIKADATTAAVTADWRVNGADQPPTTATDTTNIGAAFGQIGLGSTNTIEAPAYTAYWDDIAYSKTLVDYPIGNAAVRVLRPNVNGTHVNPSHFENRDGSPAVITPIDSTSWMRLDDATLFGGTDFVTQNTASTLSYLEFGFEDVPSETCVLGMHAWATAGSIGSSGNSIKMVAVDGAAATEIYSGPTGCGNCVRERGVMITPADTPWTEQRANDVVMRLGYQRDATPLTNFGHAMIEYATTTP